MGVLANIERHAYGTNFCEDKYCCVCKYVILCVRAAPSYSDSSRLEKYESGQIFLMRYFSVVKRNDLFLLLTVLLCYAYSAVWLRRNATYEPFHVKSAYIAPSRVWSSNVLSKSLDTRKNQRSLNSS